MSVNFSPWGNQQFLTSAGAPAVGHRLYTYVAGSTTLATTYTTSVGDVAQSNPIVLNSLGLPTTGQVWLTSGVTYKIVWTDGSDVVQKTEDNLVGIGDTAVVAPSEWIAGPTPTFISATSFSLIGDQTSTFNVGRRIKTTNSGGTIYSRISVSAFTTLTTITVVNDSGVLDSGLSAVSYGLLSATNPSIPAAAVNFTTGTFSTNAVTPVVDSGSGPLVLKGAGTTALTITAGDTTFGSAATSTATKIGNAPGTGVITSVLHLDGGSGANGGAKVQWSTNGTAIAYMGREGNISGGTSDVLLIRAENGLKINSGATLALTVSGANVVVAGTLSATGGLTGSGAALTSAGNLVFVASATAAASAQLDFTGLSATYDEYVFVLIDILPVTSGILELRMSTDGGATFQAGANSYGFTNYTKDWAAVDASTQSAGLATQIDVSGVVGNAAANVLCGEVRVFGVNSTASKKYVTHHNASLDAANALVVSIGSGCSVLAGLTTSAVNAIRFLMAAGNITSGRIDLYGVKKTA